LIQSKLEADPSLTRVLFDPAQRDFFDPKGKNRKIWEILQTQTQTKDD